jgi:hypothetical protein
MKKTLRFQQLIILVFLMFLGQISLADPLAFPGAEGFGAYAQGGRGGDVYYVTNTNDTGAGSLRYGISSATGPRTIVFAVSGIISLQSSLNVNKNYITIAGQTAPGDGICLRNYSFGVRAQHVIVRYIRSRMGDDSLQEADAMTITDGAKNVIMDHCSASWSVDECFSCSTANADAIDNVTVQWSIISEALGYSVHVKEYHSYGSLIRGCYGAKYSYLHNLYAHNNGRNPRPGNYDTNPYTSDPLGLQFDFRNNVVYNWGGSYPSYDADTVSVCRMNYVGNYFKAGPSSSYGVIYDTGSPYFKGYYEGNFWNGSIPADQYSHIDFGSMTASQIAGWKQSTPFSTGPVVTQTAQNAYTSVLAGAGASLTRDSVDARIVNEVLTGTVTYYGSTSGKAGIIDNESDVGGWPAYSSTAAPTDTDLDGMPDAWEVAHGLSPSNAADRNNYTLDVNYTNLEVYLNSLVGSSAGDTVPPAAPTGLTAAAADATISLNWNDNIESDFSGYNVYRSTTPGGGYVKINSVLLNSSNYTDTTAENGITYFYVTKAVDSSSNDSGYSNEVFATPVDMALYRDTNDDQAIDLIDLAAFVNVWLESDCVISTGWDIDNDCMINNTELNLFASHWLFEQPQQPTTYTLIATQGKAIQYKDDSGVWISEERLKTRTSGVWGDDTTTNTLDANKSYLQFDISGVTGTITSATLTIYAITASKSYNVCGLNDGVNETWTAGTINWTSAPGNNTTSGTALNTSQTVSLYSVNPTLANGAASGDVTSFVTSDTDGLVTFIMTAGGTTYMYNVIEGSYYNAAYVPVLTIQTN